MAAAFAAMATLPADGLTCGECASLWGWQPPTTKAVCCSKPPAKHRAAVPRTLRQRFASDRAINLAACGFDGADGGMVPAAINGTPGTSRRRYLLGMLSRSHEADERYELRRLLGARGQEVQAHGPGAMQTCFVFDATPPHGGRRRPSQLFNTRAWLLYEGGRRADFDLSSLTPEGNFYPPHLALDAQASWWRRAAEHAKTPAAHVRDVTIETGAISELTTQPVRLLPLRLICQVPPSPSHFELTRVLLACGQDYYALAPAVSLLTAGGHLARGRVQWVPRAKLAERGGDATSLGSWKRGRSG